MDHRALDKPLFNVLFAAAVPGLLAFSAPCGIAASDLQTLEWDEPVQVAAGGAHVGPWRMNESDWRYVDDPTVAVDPEGGAAVAWVDQRRRDVFVQRYGPDGGARLDEPVNVSRSPGIFSWLPRMVMIPDGRRQTIGILWQEIVFSGGSHGGETFFAHSTDGGRSFSEPLNLSNSTAGDGKGRLNPVYWHNGSLDLVKLDATNRETRLYAAWTEYEGRLWLAPSGDAGGSFSDPVLVAGGPGALPARAPTLAAAPGGGLYLAWTVGEDPAADIRIAYSKDGGRTFGPARVVHDSDGHSDCPRLAVDGEGTVHLFYGESPAGPLERYHIRYTRSTDGGAAFDRPKTIPALPSQRFANANFPDVSLDASGNLFLLWHLFPGPDSRPRGLGFSFSTDGGRTFAPPSVVPGTADPEAGFSGSLQGLLTRKVAVNANGSIAVVNSTFNRNEASRIRLMRGRLGDR